MILLDFIFEGSNISSNVTEHRKGKGIIEYEVEINNGEIVEELGNPIFFKIEDGFFAYKDSKYKQGEKAINFLFAFKSALDWSKDKQPDF